MGNFQSPVPFAPTIPMQIDRRYGDPANNWFYWNSVSDANMGVVLALRGKGLKVGILIGGIVVEHVWKNSTADGDLVPNVSSSGNDPVAVIITCTGSTDPYTIDNPLENREIIAQIYDVDGSDNPTQQLNIYPSFPDALHITWDLSSYPCDSGKKYKVILNGKNLS